MKTKSGNEMVTSIKDNSRQWKISIKNLQTDMGKEFYNAIV